MSQICNSASSLIPDEFANPAERNVIAGSTKFLEALSHIAMMWRHSELSEVDPACAGRGRESSNDALGLLNSAREDYRELLDIVKTHGAKQEALEALREFDYESLARATDFQGDQWEALVANAKSGNVYALLYDFVDGLNRMIDMLEDDRRYLEAGKIPPLSNFSRLMSEQQSVIMHGHQSALIFQNLGLPKVNLANH